MFGYRFDEGGSSTPIMKPLGIFCLYGTACLYAMFQGLGNSFWSILFLLPASALCACGFLMCRPRFPAYLVPLPVFLIVYLLSGNLLLALFSLAFFAYGFVIALCLRYRCSLLLSVIFLTLAMAVVLMLECLTWGWIKTGIFSIQSTWELIHSWFDQFYTLLQSELSQQLSLEIYAEYLTMLGVTAEEATEQLMAEVDKLIPLWPCALLTVLNVCSYLMHKLCFGLLAIIPTFRRVLASKQLLFPKVIAVFCLCMTLLQFFLSTTDTIAAVFLNLYYIFLPGLALLGVRALIFHIRFGEGKRRVLGIAFLVACVASLTFPAFFVLLAVPTLGVLGALVCFRMPAQH